MLTRIKYKILELLSNKIELSINFLEKNIDLKKRALYKNIEEISYDLKAYNFSEIQINNSNLLLKLDKNELQEFYKKIDYFYSSNEREDFILFSSILQRNNNIDYYVKVLNVTRTTILQDINNLKKKLIIDKFELNVINDKIFIKGDELRKRQKIIYYIFKMNYFVKKIFFVNQDLIIKQLIEKLLTDKINWYSDDYIEFLINYFSFLKIYYEEDNLLYLENDFDEFSDEFYFYQDLINKLCKEFNINNKWEKKYLNAILIAGNHKRNIFSNKKNIFYYASLKYFNQIELESFIFFKNKQKLIDEFIDHLFVTYFRLKYYLFEDYKNIDIVKVKYAKYFNLAKYNIYILEQELKVKFDSFNIVLASLYVVLYLKLNQPCQKLKAILIVSNNDIYGEILKKNLEYDFSNVEITKTLKYEKNINFKEYENYLIISTKHLDSYSYYLFIDSHSYDKKNIKEFIDQYIFSRSSNNLDFNPSLTFNKDCIKIVEKKVNWKQAIELSVETLVDQKFVSNKYFQQIILNIEKYGSYFIVDKNLAIPHASFTNDVFDSSIQLTIFKKPFQFLNDKRQIEILLSFSICNDVMNEKDFNKWMSLISNYQWISKIKQLQNSDDIYKFILKCFEKFN